MKNIIIEQVSLHELLIKIEEILKKFKERDIPKGKEDVHLLSRQETADLLKVSLCTLNHWDKKKILIPCRIGNRVYYKKEEILNVLERARATKNF